MLEDGSSVPQFRETLKVSHVVDRYYSPRKIFLKINVQVLGVGSEYAQQERLENKIQHDLRLNVREKEESRAKVIERDAEGRATEMRGKRREIEEKTLKRRATHT